MTDYALLEIGLHRHDANWYRVEPRLWLPGQDAELRPPGGTLILASFDGLETVANVDEYGPLLTDSLFAAQPLREFFAQARGLKVQDQPVGLRLRLYVGPSAPELHELRWETLRDPQKPDAVLATDENVLFSRYLSSWDWHSVRLLPKADLKALVVVANPDDLDESNLAPVDVFGELERARQGLGNLPIDALCRCQDPRCADPATGLDVNIVGQPTLNHLLDRLRIGYDILYLAAHGALVQKVPKVWLEEPDGVAHVVEPDGPDGLVTLISQLPQLPRLVVLASCQSGDGTSTDGGALAALGPRLAEAGVPAVVAMQGNVTMATVNRFMPRFFEALQEGQIEDAMAVARRTVHTEGYGDWWMPVLFSRLHSGRLWYEPTFVRKQFVTWPDLVTAIRARRCTPIVGPGLIEFLLGSPQEVALRWADASHFPLAEQNFRSLPHVARYLATVQSPLYPPSQLSRYLRDETLRRHAKLLEGEPEDADLDHLIRVVGRKRRQADETEPYQVLAQLPAEVYINANPDDLLFDALVEAGKHPQRLVCPWNDDFDPGGQGFLEDLRWRPSDREPLIYYLFGHLEKPESMVLSEDDHFAYLSWVSQQWNLGTESKIAMAVKGACSRNALVFLGFQIDDWTFRVLLQGLAPPHVGGHGRRFGSVAVQVSPDQSPYLDPERACSYLQKYLERYHNLNVYWGTLQDFVSELWSYRAQWG